MKTVRIIRKKEDFGKIITEMIRLIGETDLQEIVHRYKMKQPILLKKGTRRTYPIFASKDHPKSKAIHEFIVKMEMPRHHRVHLPRGRVYQVRHHRSERKAK